MSKESLRGAVKTIEYPPGSWVIEPDRKWLFKLGGCALFGMGFCSACGLLAALLSHG